MRDLKYLLAFLVPLSVLMALTFKGAWSYSGFYLAFIAVPILEVLFKGNQKNYSDEKEQIQLGKKVFDWQLYLNVPIVFGLLAYFLYTLSTVSLMTYEVVGLTVSMGILLGYTINVAHELGHRHTAHERFLSKLLLMPNHYMHFIIEHNLGHHKNVSTDLDPASSRKNEWIYTFYFRSMIMSYIDAWNIETKRLKRAGHSVLSIHNELIRFLFIQLAYLAVVFWAFGPLALAGAIVAGFIGILLLESVNYIEHYGLRRKKLANGHYEPVKPHHSWNSNHEFGRILLYELTRHSDHHFKSTRKYQVLRHFDESPQLPHGYPTSILIALVPPLWFMLMNKKLKQYDESGVSNEVSLALG